MIPKVYKLGIGTNLLALASLLLSSLSGITRGDWWLVSINAMVMTFVVYSFYLLTARFRADEHELETHELQVKAMKTQNQMGEHMFAQVKAGRASMSLVANDDDDDEQRKM